METSEVLYRAADLIETRGWAKGGMEGGDPWGMNGGPVCLEGAIYAAEEYKNGYVLGAEHAYDTCPAYRAMHSYLGLLNFTSAFGDHPVVEPVYRYNDAPGRTKDEVIAALRAAALIESAKEDQSIKQEVSA